MGVLHCHVLGCVRLQSCIACRPSSAGGFVMSIIVGPHRHMHRHSNFQLRACVAVCVSASCMSAHVSAHFTRPQICVAVCVPYCRRFVVVQHGLEERRTPGNTLAVQPDKPYQGLSIFGTGDLHTEQRVPGVATSFHFQSHSCALQQCSYRLVQVSSAELQRLCVILRCTWSPARLVHCGCIVQAYAVHMLCRRLPVAL